MTLIERIAQAMADHENEHRYEGGPHTSPMVEPYEASAEDFEEIATFVAQRLEGAVGPLRDLLADVELSGALAGHPDLAERVTAALLDDGGGQS